MFRRVAPSSGSRGRLAVTSLGDRIASSLRTRPGTVTPSGGIPSTGRNPKVGRGAIGAGDGFPGEGSETYPAELNNVTPRIVRRRAEPHTRFRVQHGADWDPAMAPLRLGLPWRPSPDSPAVRRGGPGTNDPTEGS